MVFKESVLKVTTLLVVSCWGMTTGHAAPITAEEIVNSSFADWQLRRTASEVVLKIDQKSGDVKAASPEETDGAEVAVPGQPGAVVETPEQSTDVPDEAAAQVEDDPQAEAELKQAEQDAEAVTPEQAEDRPDPFLVKMQVYLARSSASPGEIDGLLGENTRKAIAAFREMRDQAPGDQIDDAFWTELAKDEDSPIRTYEITTADIGERYVPDLPDDYSELAKLEWIGYRTVSEMLAERFHMDEDLLKALNPEADFTKAGTQITVLATGSSLPGQVSRIVIDKKLGELRAFGDGETPIFVAPATIGSDDTPSPEGVANVVAVVRDPTYSYNPDVNFQQGGNTRKMDIAPGPNGPVGNVWIDLSKPTYGIHGTSDPNLVSKTGSHGCVRLTNWDAARLADMVKPEVTKVEFVD